MAAQLPPGHDPLRVSGALACDRDRRGFRAFRGRRGAPVPLPFALPVRLDRAGIARSLDISAAARTSSGAERVVSVMSAAVRVVCAIERLVSPAFLTVSSATRSAVAATVVAARAPLS